ncbi:hypothetical protein [Rhodococcus sp. A14]|uniref:hypothetical protein n=1 Tax=Rhodococcus sp. A14 TaxID=1194106 RepID=UPI00141E3B86|nr:hypothetical protein [Rhodococcus sp. A14]
MSRKNGRRNQNRSPKKAAAEAATSSNARPALSRQERELLDQEMAKQSFALVCRTAGVPALTDRERAELLASHDGEATVRAVAELQSRLDVATSTTWTQDRVECDLLADANLPHTEDLVRQVRSGHRLIPPRSVTQLIREALESAVQRPDAEPMSATTLLHLILSITTSHLRNEFSEDGTLDEEGIARIAEMTMVKTAEESIEMLREIMVDEVANLHGNAPAKLETLLASTQNIWFRPWPDSVTDPRLGASPAESFASANGIDLREVLALGLVIAERAGTGDIEFRRADLVSAGATDAAISFLINHMSLPVSQFQRRLARDRAKGDIDDQRYTLTQCPFLRVDDDTVVLMRYQWGIERFFGSHLYWQTFFSFGKPEPRSVAEAFSLAMNDVFEEAVAETLTGIVSASRSMTRLVREPEMQDAWATDPSKKPSVCDFVIPAGQVCLALDATNHHLNAELAQGLANVSEYAADADESLVKKCNQIAATIRQLGKRCDHGVGPSTQYLPFVIVPAHGVPNLGTVELDLMIRAKRIFQVVPATVLAPTVLTLSELELLEGISEHIHRKGRDIRDLLVDWRRTSTVGSVLGPIRLQDYLDSTGLPRPIPTRIIEAAKQLKLQLKEYLAAGPTCQLPATS